MLDGQRPRQLLRDFDLQALFIEEFGWDHHSQTLRISLDDEVFTLSAIAQKRGMVAFRYDLPDGNGLPDYATRRKLERKVARSVHEHLIVYCYEAEGKQIWQWVKKEVGKPAQCREHRYHRTQSGEALLQKLQYLAFSLDEEAELGIVDVTSRVRAAFDVDKVTKRFYDRFQKEHGAFLGFIGGIPDEGLERWYASVMLNRLMFIYFIQKKGFLDGDPDYLSTKLGESKQRGKDRYYRDSLCPLFFEGFAEREHDRSPGARELLGNVPYLNGGIFQRHQVEELHGEAIQIPDRAFEKLFAFFEQYQWHLDERPLRDDNEINPDVLGYIFEKYINQKQMGAYYTKEDITGYIARNTVLPRLFDMARERCRVAFEGEGSVWELLREEPDRYIYNAVKKGTELPLPAEMAAGVDDVSQRGSWNTPAPEEYALPTEIWREVVARRQRCEEVRGKLANGEVRTIDDLITLNLDICQLAQDVVEDCTDPALLRAFWRSIAGWVPDRSNQEMVQGITILDPACGSGAFLFAALNILEPLYEACLERMEAFLAEEEQGDGPVRRFEDFRRVLDGVEQHPNRRYFVLKSIVVNNLYGVDIMDEAVEICKLRFFLKLVAQVDRVDNVEPLPDIDFNIRAGNTLVGFVSRAGVERALKAVAGATPGQQRLLSKEEQQELDALVEDAQVTDRAFRRFQEMQARKGVAAAKLTDAKHELRSRLAALEARLNQYLAGEYGVSADDTDAYGQWLLSHRPFHWFVDFYGIMVAGGFDTVIGNPPYVRYRDVEDAYTVVGFSTVDCGDLYALFVERALHVLNVRGRPGLIVPISVFGTDGFELLQQLAMNLLDPIWASFFANRPSQLFSGAQKRLTILIARRFEAQAPTIHTTRYFRWRKQEFEHLFCARMEYAPLHGSFSVFPTSLEKLGSSCEVSAFRRITDGGDKLFDAIAQNTDSHVYYTRKFGYFLAFLDFIPSQTKIPTGERILPSELKELDFRSSESAEVAVAALSSSTFFWFWNVLSDCRNLNKRDLLAFPVCPESMSPELRQRLATLGRRYLAKLRGTSRMMVKSGLKIETFDYAVTKPILDEIDGVLAEHFGFTDEELDFIVNYDIKYRMGREAE